MTSWFTDCCLVAKSCLTLSPWTIARQTPLSMGFPRQGCWSGLPLHSPGDLPDARIEPTSRVSFIGRQILYHCTTWKPWFMDGLWSKDGSTYQWWGTDARSVETILGILPSLGWHAVPAGQPHAHPGNHQHTQSHSYQTTTSHHQWITGDTQLFIIT